MRDKRFWTEDEIAILREVYPKAGAAAVRARLPAPGRGLGGICIKARALDVPGPGRETRQNNQRRPRNDPDIDEWIRENWPLLKGRGAVVDAASRLEKHLAALGRPTQIPRWWLSKRALVLGMADVAHKKEPKWSAAELELLKKVPLHSPDRCAAIFTANGFRRTATSIVVKSKRVGLSRRYHETLSGRAAALILGVDVQTVTAWCVAGDLPAGRRGSQRLPQQGGDPWSIERPVLRQWIIDHLERIDIRKVEKFSFVELLISNQLGAPSSMRPI